MTRVIYIASLQARSGKSLVSLGAMESAATRVSRLGFFRPIVESGTEPDGLIELMRSRYKLTQTYEQSYGVTTAETRSVGEHVTSVLVHRILAKFEALARSCDLVIVEGTDYQGASAAFEFSLNAQIAANLGAACVVVSSAHHHKTHQISGALDAARTSLADHHVQVLALVINRVHQSQWDELSTVAADLPGVPVWLLPEMSELNQPTLADIERAIGSERLFGTDEGMRREVSEIIVGAMTIPNLMDHLNPDALVVTPGDRADVVLMALAAQFSSGLPSAAGLVLTGGYRPQSALMRFAEGLGDRVLPILLSKKDTFSVTDAVASVGGSIEGGDDRKVALALRIFEDHIDVPRFEERLSQSASATITPVMFERQLIARARADKRSIVLPEGEDDRILLAADRIQRRDAAELTILGNEADIRHRTEVLGLNLSSVRIIDPVTSPLRERFGEELFRIRRHKGISEAAAFDTVGDVSWFGTMMVQCGEADGMVSGAAHTTANTVRPALQIIRTTPGVSVVSSAFLMALEDRVLVFADCAVLPDPNAEQLADIAISSAETARSFGIEPRVAMLSYSTGSSGSGADVQKVAKATELVHERAPDLLAEGPIQYDAAVDPGVGASKLPGSKVAGQATVLIFPDLNTGNNTYKAVQRSGGALAIGPVLQGLRLPVNDLSRGATVDDIVNTVVITAIQAQSTALQAQSVDIQSLPNEGKPS